MASRPLNNPKTNYYHACKKATPQYIPKRPKASNIGVMMRSRLGVTSQLRTCGDSGTVGLRGVLQVPGVVPGAGSASIGTLVASELVDQDARVAIQVGRTVAATSGAARSGGRAVGLVDVLQVSSLVIPGACATGVRALVARVHVDEDAAVPVQVGRAFAITSTSIARKRDGLSSRLTTMDERRDRFSSEDKRNHSEETGKNAGGHHIEGGGVSEEKCEVVMSEVERTKETTVKRLVKTLEDTILKAEV